MRSSPSFSLSWFALVTSTFRPWKSRGVSSVSLGKAPWTVRTGCTQMASKWETDRMSREPSREMVSSSSDKKWTPWQGSSILRSPMLATWRMSTCGRGFCPRMCWPSWLRAAARLRVTWCIGVTSWTLSEGIPLPMTLQVVRYPVSCQHNFGWPRSRTPTVSSLAGPFLIWTIGFLTKNIVRGRNLGRLGS